VNEETVEEMLNTRWNEKGIKSIISKKRHGDISGKNGMTMVVLKNSSN